MSQWVLTYVPIAHCVLCPNDFVAVLMLNKYCWKIFVPMINSHMSQWRKKMTKSPNWDLSPDKRRTLKNKKMTKFCHWDSSSSDAISSGSYAFATYTHCLCGNFPVWIFNTLCSSPNAKLTNAMQCKAI